jgi:hypothetical protein
MTAPDDRDPSLTRAFGLWAETAVPALPADFTAQVMADVARQRVGEAWAETAVPALPADFAATVAAKAAARPKLAVVTGGAATSAPARRWWQWPAVAVAAAALLALLSSRATTTGPGTTMAQRDGTATPTTPPAVSNPVAVAMAEVTRVEVLGAQSVAVLSLPGEGGGSGSPVVWITDKAEDDPAGGLETRMQ